MNAVAMRSARTASVARASSAASKAAITVPRAAPLAAAAAKRRGSDVRRRAVSAQAEAEASAATPSEAEAEAAPAAEAAAASGTSSARFGLNFLWLDKNVGVAVDALYSRAGASSSSSSEGGSAPSSSSSAARAPLTEYFMWPRKDAWEELKAALEAKPWVPERDRVLLLNRTTEVINFWQDEGTKHTVEEAREKFPDCVFSSS